MSATYRAIRLDRFAPSFRDATTIVDLPLGEAGAGEVGVHNRWCVVNAMFDTQIARNTVEYVAVRLPTLTGVEAVGTVEAVGAGVSGLSVGDAVAATRFTDSFREAKIAPAEHFAKVPPPICEWLALASTGVSPPLALEHTGALRDGETVAISAAAGLGHLLVQLAPDRGCRVVAVCGGPRMAAFVQGLGAQRVIDHHAEDVSAVLAADYPNRIDVAIGTVGGTIFDAFVANLALHGRLVAFGAASDLDGWPEIVAAPRIVHRLCYKAASVRGFMNGLLPELWPAARDKLFALHRNGRLAVTFDEPVLRGLPQVYDAIGRLLSGASMGKVVVAFDPAATIEGEGMNGWWTAETPDSCRIRVEVSGEADRFRAGSYL